MPLTALIIDDEALARQELQYLLDAAGGVSVLAQGTNGIDAVNLIRIHKPDVIFLDVRMPGLDGFAVLKKVLALDRKMKLPQVVFATAFDQYAAAKAALLAGSYLTSQSCSTFFNAKGRSNYFSQLTSAVTNQVPFDGLQTTINMYDAGFWNITDTNKSTFPKQWQKTPVCSNFNPSDTKLTVAEAQLQPPATDVYINTRQKVWKKYLTQSTILHEALHNLTGLEDDALAETLGTRTTSTGGTTTINAVLVSNGCAAN